MKKIYFAVSFLLAWALTGTVLAASLNLSRTITPVTTPTNKITNTAEVKGINPQPEPPKIKSIEVEADKIDVPVEINLKNNLKKVETETGDLKINKNAKLERTGLNPQPEPPMPTEELPVVEGVVLKTEKANLLGLKRCLVGNAEDKVKIDDEVTWGKCGRQANLPGQDIASLKKCVLVDLKNGTNKIDDEVTWSKCEGEINALSPQPDPPGRLEKIFSINSDLEIQGTKVTFFSSSTGTTTEFKMKTALPAFYEGLTRALRKSGASTTIDKLKLKMVDGKLAYEAETIEPVKLFGLIPLKVNTKIIIDAEKEKVVGVNRPWYSAVATKANLSGLKLLPNLNITKLTVTASNGGPAVDGAPGKVVADVTNDGATYLIVSPPIMSGGHRMDFYGDSQWLGAYVLVMFLKPGESVQFDYNWPSVKCGSTVKVEAALDQYLEEATKDDNTATAPVACN